MTDDKRPNSEPKRYPPFWEKWVPVLVTIIVLIVVGLIVVALAVIIGWFPSSA
jgi:hypothetical protein